MKTDEKEKADTYDLPVMQKPKRAAAPIRRMDAKEELEQLQAQLEEEQRQRKQDYINSWKFLIVVVLIDVVLFYILHLIQTYF